jgi:hypothetical protein
MLLFDADLLEVDATIVDGIANKTARAAASSSNSSSRYSQYDTCTQGPTEKPLVEACCTAIV